jgi:hypothetical protein
MAEKTATKESEAKTDSATKRQLEADIETLKSEYIECLFEFSFCSEPAGLKAIREKIREKKEQLAQA